MDSTLAAELADLDAMGQAALPASGEVSAAELLDAAILRLEAARGLNAVITDVFDRKVAALAAHASQTSHMGEELRSMLAEWGHANAAGAGLSAERLAERFKVVPTA